MILNFNENVKESVLCELGLKNSFHRHMRVELIRNEQELIAWLEECGLTDRLVYVVGNEREKTAHINLSELDKVILMEEYNVIDKYYNNDDYFILYVEGRSCFYYIDITKVDDMLNYKDNSNYISFMERFKGSLFYQGKCDDNTISISLDFYGDKVSDNNDFYDKIYFKFFDSIFDPDMKDDVIYRPHYDSNNNLFALTVDMSYLDYDKENVDNVKKVIKKMFSSYENCKYTNSGFDVIRAEFSKPFYDFLPDTASFLIYSYNS